MKSFKEWRLDEAGDPAWEAVKSSSLGASDILMSRLRPRIDGIVEEIVRSHSPQVKSFRDMDPAMREQYAKAIVQLTLEAFYPSAVSSKAAPVSRPAAKGQPVPAPQDDTVAPAASKG